MATPQDNQALADQAVKLGYVKTPQEYLAAEERGRQLAKTAPGIAPIDASKVGTTKPMDIPNKKNTSKTDKAMAGIVATPPATPEPTKSSFGDIVSQSLANIKDPEQKAMVQQLLDAADQTTGGKFSQAGEDVLSKLLDTQFSQKKRKSEEARLQEQAGLPELFAEQALIESNYDTSEAARNSRLLNETGGKTTISKSALSNRQSEIQRQYGLQVADNRINELVVAGKINSANILIDKKMDLKYGDLEAEIDLYKSQLEAITPFMNNEQQKIAEQRQFLLNQAQAEIQSARDVEKTLQLQKVDALKNARDRGASALQLAQIQDAQSSADLAATGFLTSALEKAQLSTEYLQQANIKSQIKEREATAAASEKPLSADAAKVVGIANTLIPELETLKQKFKDDYRGTILKIKLGTDPELVKLVSNAADKVGRLRSGGAVNPDEEKRFRNQILSTSDYFFGSADKTGRSIDGVITEAQTVLSGVEGGITSALSNTKPADNLDDDTAYELYLKAATGK